MLNLDMKPGDTISIGGIATVTLVEKSGRYAKLAIEADRSVPIKRVQKTTAAEIAAQQGLTGSK